MRKLKFIPMFLIICVVAFWVFSIIKIEILTAIHKEELYMSSAVSGRIGEPDKIKVMNITDEAAQVYLFNDGGGIIIDFIKDGDSWEYEKGRAVWSRAGSADGIIWPYFYHSAEGLAIFLVMGFPVFLIAIFVLCIGKYK